MRICRYEANGNTRVAYFEDERLIPLAAAADACTEDSGRSFKFDDVDDLLSFLPGGDHAQAAKAIYEWLEEHVEAADALSVETQSVHLRVPVPRPNKLFLLAGNYAKHIEEGGGIAAEREETFPYVFMKPPTTTLTDPNQPINIPRVSPNAIDWELELAVVIGRTAKSVSEVEALDYVAGYTIVNDISDRKFRPNSNRKTRDRDSFFDWLHGKWHDSFCPCGPCVTSSETIPDPQKLALELRYNDEVRQDSSTAHQVFPVAAVIEFISSFVTLEPGDIISTGTPDGVGNTTGTYLKPGDKMRASISSIGTLQTPVRG